MKTVNISMEVLQGIVYRATMLGMAHGMHKKTAAEDIRHAREIAEEEIKTTLAAFGVTVKEEG